MFTACVCVVLIGGCAVITPRSDKITIVSYNVRGTFGDSAQEQGKAEQIALELQEYGLERSSIILFQEIDNHTIVRDLISEYLALNGFRYAVTAPLRGSSITQAVISKYPIVATRTHTISYDQTNKTRAFLEVVIRIGDHELVLYNLHLKSKRGGATETEPQRAAVMRALRQRIEEQLRIRPGLEIVIAGDMNSEVGEVTEEGLPIALAPYNRELADHDGLRIAQLSDLPIAQQRAGSVVFVSPWQDANWHGSYEYRQQWEQIDHFFLSTTLFNGAAFEYDGFRVAIDEQGDDENGSINPFNAKNASDHLPIVLSIVLQ